MILLKIFFVPLNWNSSPSSTSTIFRFDLWILSQISWIFYARRLLYLTFSLTDIFISSIESSTPKILSSISCIPLGNSSHSNFLNFHLQYSLSLCLLYCFYFHFHVWSSFILCNPLDIEVQWGKGGLSGGLYRTGEKTEGFDLEELREGGDLQLVFLFSWLKWPVGFQGMPAWVGCRDKAMSGDVEVWRVRSVKSTGDGSR